MTKEASDKLEKVLKWDWRDAWDMLDTIERRPGSEGVVGRSLEWGERRPCRSMRCLGSA